MSQWQGGVSSETTAAEVSRNFGHWQDRALQGPVLVTHHGRPRVVMIAAAEFDRLISDQEHAFETPAWSQAALEAETALSALTDSMAEGFMALDDKLRITAVNPVVEAFIGRSAADVVGKPVESLEPGDRADVFIDRYRWVLRSGEMVTFEASTYLRSGPTLNIRAFPYRAGVGVILRNVTEITTLREEKAQWSAQRAALDAQGEIAGGHLSVLGFFLTANPTFASLVGFSETQLSDMRLADLVNATDRQALMCALNELMRQTAEVQTLEVELLTRHLGRVRLRLALAAKMRDLICEGFYFVGLPPAAANEAAPDAPSGRAAAG